MFFEQTKELAAEEFKRLTGVKAETFAVMVEILREAGLKKRKPGRPSKLSLEDQVLMTLMYLREHRTYFHIAHTYRLNTSSAFRIIRHVEDTLSKAEVFSLFPEPNGDGLACHPCTLRMSADVCRRGMFAGGDDTDASG